MALHEDGLHPAITLHAPLRVRLRRSKALKQAPQPLGGVALILFEIQERRRLPPYESAIEPRALTQHHAINVGPVAIAARESLQDDPPLLPRTSGTRLASARASAIRP